MSSVLHRNQKKSNLNQKHHWNCFLMQLQRSDSFASDVESFVHFATPTQYPNMSHLFYLPVLGVASKSQVFLFITTVWRTYVGLCFWFVINQVLPIKYFWMLTTGFCFRIDTRPVTVPWFPWMGPFFWKALIKAVVLKLFHIKDP